MIITIDNVEEQRIILDSINNSLLKEEMRLKNGSIMHSVSSDNINENDITYEESSSPTVTSSSYVQFTIPANTSRNQSTSSTAHTISLSAADNYIIADANDQLLTSSSSIDTLSMSSECFNQPKSVDQSTISGYVTMDQSLLSTSNTIDEQLFIEDNAIERTCTSQSICDINNNAHCPEVEPPSNELATSSTADHHTALPSTEPVTSDYITYPAPIPNVTIALELDDCLSPTANSQYQSAAGEQQSPINCCAAQEESPITGAIVTTSPVPVTGYITNTSNYLTYPPQNSMSYNQSVPHHVSQSPSDYVSYQLPNSCAAQPAISSDTTHNADHSGYVSYQTQDHPALNQPPPYDTVHHTVSPELDCFPDDIIDHQSLESQESQHKDHTYMSDYTYVTPISYTLEKLTIVGTSMTQPHLNRATSDISGSSDYITINQYPR